MHTPSYRLGNAVSGQGFAFTQTDLQHAGFIFDQQANGLPANTPPLGKVTYRVVGFKRRICRVRAGTCLNVIGASHEDFCFDTAILRVPLANRP